MNKDDNTFSLEDLDANFWENLIFFEIRNSSGLGGPGCLWLITSEPKRYFIGFEGFPYSDQRLEEFHPLFEWILEENEKYKSHRRAEELGFVKHSKDNAFIKAEYYEKFCDLWQKQYDRNVSRIHHVFSTKIMSQVLGCDEVERVNWEVSARIHEELQEFMQRVKEEHKRKELTDKYFDWYPVYMNNSYSECYDERGWYCLILKEVEKQVSGYRFTIMYQREEIEPLVMNGLDAPIEKYILFEKRYDDVIGNLRYPDSREPDKSSEEYGLTYDITNTLNNMDLNDRGSFIRTFDSLDEAKEYAIAVVNKRSYANTENIITKKNIEDTTRKYTNLARKYNAIVMLKKYAVDIIKFVSEYEFPSERSGGGVCNVAAEKLGIDKELMHEIWQYIPMELLPRTQRKAEKILLDLSDGSDT